MFSFDSPETRAYARKWLARPIPEEPKKQDNAKGYSVELAEKRNWWDAEIELRTWSAVLLLKKDDSKDHDLAIVAFGKLFDDMKLNLMPGSRPLFIEELRLLLKANRKDTNDLACRLGEFLYSTGSLEKLHSMLLENKL
jgi:hypothetical protein